MTNRDFMTWLSGFRYSIADYGYYIDFEKVHRNVKGIKVELNILNSLIGSKNIEADFEALLEKYPEILKCIPLLIAVRAMKFMLLTVMEKLHMNLRSLICPLNNIRCLCVKRDCLI